jgi:hypothetical protein
VIGWYHNGRILLWIDKFGSTILMQVRQQGLDPDPGTRTGSGFWSSEYHIYECEKARLFKMSYWPFHKKKHYTSNTLVRILITNKDPDLPILMNTTDLYVSGSHNTALIGPQSCITHNWANPILKSINSYKSKYEKCFQ